MTRNDAKSERRYSPALVVASVGLVVLVLAVFGPTVSHDFVNFDDGLYVTANPHVQRGLDPESIRWAMTSFDASNWHPLTWLSHMLDVEMAGLDPGRHHLTNVLLHALAAVLLLLALQRLTGQFWPSVLVAFLFAVHPLRAESVAWVAERKDVLSGVFWMSTMWLWAWYAERPSPRRYLAVAISFVLGLASKPMTVTLPMVLLLLDIWPLRRAQPDPADGAQPVFAWKKLVSLAAEKLPLLGLAVGSSVLTVMAQQSVIGTFEAFPFGVRLANAVVSWFGYIRTTVFPSCLSAFYPHSGTDLSPILVVIAAGVLIGVSVAAVVQLRGRPWLAVGWFWYLGTLVPVIGLIQVGTQSMADRYTYIPQIGLWIILAWTMVEVIARRPGWRPALVGGAVVLIVVFASLAARQAATWKNGMTVFSQAIKCTENNWLAHANLAEMLVAEGRYEEAVNHCRRSIEINPANPVPHVNAGNALVELDRAEEAVVHYEAALEIDPDRTVALYNLGNAQIRLARHEEAANSFRRVLEIEPDLTIARNQLGVELLYLGRPFEAVEVLCVETTVANPTLMFNCGLALATDGRLEEAVGKFRAAIEIQPDYGAAWIGLGNSLADLGRDDEAVVALRRAQQLRPDNARVQRRLAQLLLDSGRE